MNTLSNRKILYVIGQLRRGGAEQQLFYLIKYLKPQARVVSLTEGGYWAGPIRDLGIEVIELERRNHLDWSRLKALIQIIRTYRPEIVDIFLDNLPGLYGRLAALVTTHPCVIIRERADIALQQPYWYQKLKRLLNTQVAAVVTNSKANLRYLVSKGMASPDKLCYIQNGLEIERFADNLYRVSDVEARRRVNKNLVVGTVGSLQSVKAPDVFVHVASQVLASYPETHFVHVGDGPLREKMEALSRELKIQDALVFLGERQDIPAQLASMDVFVLTSVSEGMPNAVMEAMASGLPCVVTDAGDCRELVREGESGFVVPVGDQVKLADRISLLLRDGALRHHMGLVGQEHIREFDVHRMTEQTRELYNRVLSNG